MTTLKDLTHDPYELDILAADHVEEIEPDDPHYREVARITSEIAHISRKLPAKRRGVARRLLEGKTQVQIAQEVGCSPQTVSNALADPGVQRQIVLMQRLNHIRSGPAEDARQAMAWRIAMREEEKRPSISLNALNLLNKMDGTYTEDVANDTGVVIKVQNFTVNVSKDDEEKIKDVNNSNGGFAPVTIDA